MNKLLRLLVVAAPLVFSSNAFADIPGPSSSSAGGSGGSGGAGGAAASSSSSGGSTPDDNDDGCSMVAPGRAKAGAAGVWLIGLGALAWGRRKRKA